MFISSLPGGLNDVSLVKRLPECAVSVSDDTVTVASIIWGGGGSDVFQL